MSKSKHPSQLIGGNKEKHQISNRDYRRAVERAKKKALKKGKKILIKEKV